MNTNLLRTTILIFGLVFCANGMAATTQPDDAQGRQAKMERKMEKMHGKMKGYAHVVLMRADELGLTDEQLGKIVRIQMASKKAKRKTMMKLHKTMMQARKGLMDHAADEAAIREKSKAHAVAFETLIDEALKARAKINAVLTPAQLEKLKTMKHADDSME